MGAISTTACVVAGVIGFGILAGGGPVQRPDGTIDFGATVQRGAGVGGAELGDAVGKTTDGLGTGLADGVSSAIGSSDLAKAAAAGAGGYGAYRLWSWNQARNPDQDQVGGGPSDDEAPSVEGGVLTPVPAPAGPDDEPETGVEPEPVRVPSGLILPPGVDLGEAPMTANFDDWSWADPCPVGGGGVTWMSAC